MAPNIISAPHWDPLGDLADLRGRFDRVLGEFGKGGERSWTLPVDVVRQGDNLLVRADIPGIKPDEVQIVVEDDVLTISGEHKESTEAKEGDYLRRERVYGAFSRSIALPRGVDPRHVKATAHDGLVEVTVPLPKDLRKEKVEITPTAS